jgi:hypothetical protein
MAQRAGRRRQADYFDQIDPAVYMLALPKSHPRLGSWIILTILVGSILALFVVVIGNLIF